MRDYKKKYAELHTDLKFDDAKDYEKEIKRIDWEIAQIQEKIDQKVQDAIQKAKQEEAQRRYQEMIRQIAED